MSPLRTRQYFTEPPAPDPASYPTPEHIGQAVGRVLSQILQETTLHIAPPPPSPPPPIFTGADCTDFLECWEAMCVRSAITPTSMITELPFYCATAALREEIRCLYGFEEQVWEDLREEMLKEYRKTDARQSRASMLQLTTLCRVQLEEQGELRAYVKRFTSLSAQVVRQGGLAEGERCRLLLGGLDGRIQGKVVMGLGEEGEGYRWGEVRRALLRICDAQDYLQRLEEECKF